MTDWSKLKVPELKAELKNRGLLQTGLKAALVARLSTADNESGFESEATIQDDPEDASVNSLTPTIPDVEPEPIATPHIEESTAESQLVLPDESLKETIPPKTPPSTVAESLSAPEPEGKLQSDLDVSVPAMVDTTPKSSLPPTDSQEVTEDVQKRKRRSVSSPPTSNDAPRKRARQDKDLPFTDLGDDENLYEAVTSKHNVDSIGKIDVEYKAPLKLEMNVNDHMEDVYPDKPQYTEQDQYSNEAGLAMTVADKASTTLTAEEESLVKARDSRFKELFLPQLSKTPSDTAHENVSSHQGLADAIVLEPDRYVAPSIHPATSALYIRDFMRPLNAAALKEHLVTLATPPGATPDPTIIVDFFLDPIRTHSFITFTNISAASRVRSELHEKIWPDERTRKALWVDFVPPERIQAWVEEEHQSSGSSRPSAAKKWEVAYSFRGGDLVLSLQEAGITPASARKSSFAQASVPGPSPIRQTIPSQPRIQDPPSGPRISGPRSALTLATLDQLFKSTVTKPILYYQPVSKEIAAKRLDNLDYATSKQYSRGDGGSEINRYTFEDRDVLVDRGKEIFSGIRPPPGHRGRGGVGGYRGGRGGRGGGGGSDRYSGRDRYEGRRRDDFDGRR